MEESPHRTKNLLIIPVYNNTAMLESLMRDIAGIHQDVPGGIEAIMVVDGSPDDSYCQLQRLLPQQLFPSRLISLSRNFGSFAAIRAGLAASDGDYYAVMAADLQDPPEAIRDFFLRLRHGDCDVVFGRREGRDDPAGKTFTSNLFWWFYRKYVHPDMPKGGVDIFGCARNVRDQIVRMEESRSSLVGLLVWIGFRRAEVPYIRRKRPSGKSGWSIKRRLRYMIDSTFAFSQTPIHLIILTGAVVLMLSIAYLLLLFMLSTLGLIGDARGFPTLAGLVVGFGSLNLLAIGVVGQYAWRGYENSKHRPQYILLSDHAYNQTPSSKSIANP